MDSNDTFDSDPIELEHNPTVFRNELIIKSNTLHYGTYKIVYWVYVKIDVGYLTDIKNEIEYLVETYFKIVPSGIAVFFLQNALDFIKLGNKQTLELNPIKYAYDMDFLV